MDRDRRLSLIVGGFVIFTLALLALSILSLSSEQGIFTRQYRLLANFENVQGLLPGAPVWVAGKQVGSVDRVEFTQVGIGYAVQVVLKIEESVQERVRRDSVATIGTIGLLGDSYVEIVVGTPTEPMLADGDSIRTVTPSNVGEVMVKGTRALDNIADLASNLNDVVKTFSSEDGGTQTATAIAAMSDIITEVQQGSGLLHSLIYDDYDGSALQSIDGSLAVLDDIMNEVRTGEGILHSLIYEAPSDQDLVVQTLQAGARLNSILSKIDQGEGTFGLLLNDPSVYEDLKQLLGGAQRSTVVRSLIRLTTDSEP
ncbi:MAG: MlaD family protein [Proteobacteria bacterium]|nr:MlaD family protein [Pseudomonadota bacterium]